MRVRRGGTAGASPQSCQWAKPDDVWSGYMVFTVPGSQLRGSPAVPGSTPLHAHPAPPSNPTTQPLPMHAHRLRAVRTGSQQFHQLAQRSAHSAREERAHCRGGAAPLHHLLARHLQHQRGLGEGVLIISGERFGYDQVAGIAIHVCFPPQPSQPLSGLVVPAHRQHGI